MFYDEGWLYFLIFVGVVVFLAIDIAISRKFESIAESKGQYGYFWWCFLLGTVGWAMVIALPDRGAETPDYFKEFEQKIEQQKKDKMTDDELPDL